MTRKIRFSPFNLLIASLLSFLMVAPGSASSGPVWLDAYGRSLYIDRQQAASWESALRLPAPPASQQPDNPIASTGSLFKPYVAYSGEGSANAVGIGDFNHDGLNDVVASGGGLRIYLQNAQGALEYSKSYSAGSGRIEIAVGDLNSDGWDDVVASSSGNDAIGVFLQKEDGTLQDQRLYAARTDPDAVVVADFNNDGKDDVAVSHWNAGYVGVFYQQADGSLSAVVSYPSPQAGFDDIDAGDVNHDGLTDIVKMNGQGSNPDLSVYYQQLSGGFSGPISFNYGSSWLPGGVAVGDITGDGRDDVALAILSNRPNSKLVTFTQDQAGALALGPVYSAYDAPESIEIEDVNMDGLLDVIVLQAGWQRLGVFLQSGNGALLPYQLYYLPYASNYEPQGLDLGDINNDGTPDVVIGDYNSGVVVLYNAITPDFGLSVNQPVVSTILQGDIAHWQLSLAQVLGFAEPVFLSIEGLPAGSSYTFTANPKTPPGTVDLYAVPPASTPPDFYQFTVVGQSGALQHTVEVQLRLLEAVTGLGAVNSGPGTLAVPVVFTATIATGSEVYYLWDFGDGETAMGDVVEHLYTDIGLYTATVKAYNTLSYQTALTQVAVFDEPVAGPVIYPVPLHLTGLLMRFVGFVQQGTNVEFIWDFGDGCQGSGGIADHRYDWPGIYLVRMTAFNSISRAIAEYEITISPPPFRLLFPSLYNGLP